jgi:hypothetical protein
MDYEKNQKVQRGQTLRTETGRDRSDDEPTAEMLNGKSLGGGKDSLAHSISNGKVPQD